MQDGVQNEAQRLQDQGAKVERLTDLVLSATQMWLRCLSI